MQWQPDGLTIHTKKRFLGSGFLGAPPIIALNYTLYEGFSLGINDVMVGNSNISEIRNKILHNISLRSISMLLVCLLLLFLLY